MTEVRIEVVNEDEAREYCKLHNLEFVTCYFNDDNNLMMLATSEHEELSEEEEKYLEEQYNKTVKDCVVFYVTDSGTRLYIGNDNGLTADIGGAKKFTYKDARLKAIHATRTGNYTWKFFKLKNK